MKDEEFVRAHWFDGIDLDSDEEMGIFFYQGDSGLNFQTWAAAAEFTRERLEQIRQREEEISYMEFYDFSDQAEAARERILARLESALADLKRGMKA